MLNVGRRIGGMTGLGLGAIGLAGVAGGIGSSAKNAVLDYAFNDPNADEAFMGRPMSSAFLGSAGAYGTAGAVGMSLGTAAVGGLVGAGGVAKIIPKGMNNRGSLIAAGAAVGGMLGASVGGMNDAYNTYGPAPTAGMNVATTGIGAGIGGAIGGIAKRGIKGGLMGAAVGGLVGAAAVPAMTMGRVRNNRELLNNSPYSSSLAMAQALNASGDIVLGMHNSRSSY